MAERTHNLFDDKVRRMLKEHQIPYDPLHWAIMGAMLDTLGPLTLEAESHDFDLSLKDQLHNHHLQYQLGDWEMMEKMLDADLSAIDQNTDFDASIKDKLQEHQLSSSPSDWAIMESMLDTDLSQSVNQDFDGHVKSQLTDHQLAYQNGDWEIMQDLLDSDEKVVAGWWNSYKPWAAAAILLLVSLSTGLWYTAKDALDTSAYNDATMVEARANEKSATLPAVNQKAQQQELIAPFANTTNNSLANRANARDTKSTQPAADQPNTALAPKTLASITNDDVRDAEDQRHSAEKVLQAAKNKAKTLATESPALSVNTPQDKALLSTKSSTAISALEKSNKPALQTNANDFLNLDRSQSDILITSGSDLATSNVQEVSTLKTLALASLKEQTIEKNIDLAQKSVLSEGIFLPESVSRKKNRISYTFGLRGSYLTEYDYDRLQLATGFGYSRMFHKNFSVSAGVKYAQYYWRANNISRLKIEEKINANALGPNDNLSRVSETQGDALTGFQAEFAALEIPVMLNVHFLARRKFSPFIGLGINTVVPVKQSFAYDYYSDVPVAVNIVNGSESADFVYNFQQTDLAQSTDERVFSPTSPDYQRTTDTRALKPYSGIVNFELGIDYKISDRWGLRLLGTSQYSMFAHQVDRHTSKFNENLHSRINTFGGEAAVHFNF